MNVYILQKVYRLAKSARLRLAMLKTGRLFGMRTLLVRLDLNNYCNIRCIMCPLGHAPVANENRIQMSLAEYEKIAADLFPKTRSLVLSCGFEPLVVRHFDQCLRIAKRYRVPFVSFATNGMRLDEAISRVIVEERIDEVIVSADAPDAETFESIRVGARFDIVTRNVRRLSEIKKEMGADLPTLRVNYTMMDSNIGRIPEFVQLFSGLGMSMLELRPVELRDPDVAAKVGPLLTQTGADEYARILPRIEAACREKNIRLLALPSLSADGDPAAPNVSANRNHCILPWLCAYIGATGDFAPCPSGPVTGNLLQSTYAQIMQNEKTAEFLSQIRRPNPYCDRCFIKDETVG